MADVFSILSANYKTVGLTVPSKTPYVAVDPALYQGNWTGKYADNKVVQDLGLERHRLSRQGPVPERRHQQIPGRPDQGQFVSDRRYQVHADQDRKRRRSRTSSPIPRPAEPARYGLRDAEPLIQRSRLKPCNSGLAVGGEQTRRLALGQVEGVEIGAAAQDGFIGKLLHHLARPVIDDLIDDRCRGPIDQRSDAIPTRSRHRTRYARALVSAAATLWAAGSSVLTA